LIVVQVLGGAIITCGDYRVRASSARTFAMALYLAAERGRYLNRAVALATLFGDQPDANGAHSFRQFVYKLRSVGFPIESRETDLRLPADVVHIDVDDVLAARQITAEQLAAIQRGVLPDVSVPKLPLFNEWLEGYRNRVERELQQALVKQLGAAREVADWVSTERTARACLALDPLNEEATLALAEALAIGGSKAAAVKLLEEYSSEVGVASGDLKVAANVLRRRISERLPEPGYRAKAELPFVGREVEMGVLRERLRRAAAGDSNGLLIIGEPGIGKTRLTREFANVAVLDGARVAAAEAHPHDVQRPLGAFLELVPVLLNMPGALGCSPESMQALRHLISRQDADGDDFGKLEPEARYTRITTAIRDLIEAIAGECLLVLLVEDGHWLDPLSLQFIGGLVVRRGERRLLVLLTSRERAPEAQRGHDGQLEALRLLPLAPVDGRYLARLALPTVEGVDEIAQRVQDTAGGNPLFVTSLALHWREPATRFTTPASVTSLINYQLERVSITALTVLHTVILLGRYCTVSRVAECLGVTSLAIADALQELEDRSLIAADSSTTACRHWLISEAAIAAAPTTKLRWLHTCVAELLERDSRAQGETGMLFDAAEHWIAASEGERAYAALVECAAAAAAIGRTREACDIFARASEFTSDHVKRIGALERAIHHAMIGSETLRAYDLFAELRRLEASIPSDLALFEIVADFHRGEDVAVVRSRIEAFLTGHRSDLMYADAAVLLIKLADSVRDRSLADLGRAVRDRAHQVPRASRLEFDLVYETAFGSIDAAESVARELLSITAAWGVARRVSKCFNIAQVFFLSGQIDDSITLHQDIFESGMRIGLRRIPLASAMILASLFRDTGDVKHHELWASRAREVVRSDPSLRGSEVLAFEVEAALWRNDPVSALKYAAELEHVAAVSRNSYLAEGAQALAAAAHHLAGRQCDTLLAALNIDVERRRGLRADDIVIQVACEELFFEDRAADGHSLLATYLTQSRCVRSPLSFGLRRLVDRVSQAAASETDRRTA